MKLKERTINGTIIHAVALFVVFVITSAPTKTPMHSRHRKLWNVGLLLI